MDKKYKAIKTLKELDLSRGTRSSLSSISGKSDFSTKSQEEAFNKAYANDFSMTPPKTPTPSKKLSPIRPKTAPLKKLSPLRQAPMNFDEIEEVIPQKPKKLPPLKAKHPLDPDDPIKKFQDDFFIKSLKIKPTPSPPKTSLIEEHPVLQPEKEIARISIPKKQNKFSFKDPADIDTDYLLIKNKNTPTDPKYKKKQLKLQFEDFSPGAYVANEVVGDPYGKYEDPERLLKAKKLIDERLRRFLGRNDPNVPAKYEGIGDTTAGYNQDYFNLSAPSSPAKPLTPKPPPTPPKKRGRPLGSKNKTKS